MAERTAHPRHRFEPDSTSDYAMCKRCRGGRLHSVHDVEHAPPRELSVYPFIYFVGALTGFVMCRVIEALS